MSLVVDASIAVKWFVQEAEHPLAVRLLRFDLVAPDLILAETANVLWQKLRVGDVNAEQAEEACLLLPALFAQIVPSRLVIEPAFGLARELDHPVYDCLYLSCADRLAAKLVTADGGFARKVKASKFADLVISLEDAEAFALGR